jgi:phospholipid/cholesterol/gamma-HCH transport system ATP-binding protein
MSQQPQAEISDTTPAIELVDVTAGYSGRIVLDGVSLTIKHGEIFTIIGLSGSGKSTLLKLIIGFLRPESGKIFIEGEDVTHYSEQQFNSVRIKMGMVFQRAALFDSMNVFENVAFPLRFRKSVPVKDLPKVVASKLADVDMEGTELLMPDELSGGMQKRVGLARALAESPSIILYDEPTTGLDPVITNNINRLILRTRDRYKATSVVISHDMESVFRISDRVAVLVDGKIVVVGTPAEIQASTQKDVQAFIHGEEIPSHHHMLTRGKKKGVFL